MSSLRLLRILLILLATCTGQVLAQVSAGTISGTVKDETGAVLPGVTITIKQLGRTLTLATDELGGYEGEITQNGPPDAYIVARNLR